MGVFLYFKSGKQFEFIPQIRLTHSKNGTTGTAIFELNLLKHSPIINIFDPVYGVGVQKDNTLRMADICQFIWASGKPIRVIGIFIFSTLEEKQEFFNYYPYYALNKCLEFFPAFSEEKTLDLK